MLIGQELPKLILAPLTRATIAIFAGACGDDNPHNIDSDAAKRAGFEDVFAQGMLSMAYLGRLLTSWIPQQQLREFSVRFCAITHIRDVVICTGRIVERFEADGEQRVRVEITATTEGGTVTLRGTAIAAVSPVKQNRRSSSG